MPTPPQALISVPAVCVNQRLLGTALAGLLCLATASCSGKQETPDASGSTAGATDVGGTAGAPATAGGSASASGAAGAPAHGGTASAGGAGGAGGNGDALGGTAPAAGGTSDAAGTGGADVAGAGGSAPELPHITSQTEAGVLAVDDFTTLCDERGGTVEVMPHCGGFATAKGFSYDTGTQLLSEHTCMGTNTCGGWNCVLTD